VLTGGLAGDEDRNEEGVWCGCGCGCGCGCVLEFAVHDSSGQMRVA
jgi:hypothetical protein